MNELMSDCNLQPVQPEHTYDGEAAEMYDTVGIKLREEIVNNLSDKYDERVTNTVLGPLWDWKRSSYGNYAQTHEALYKDEFNIASPLRNGDLIHAEPTNTQKKLARDLYQQTQQFLRRVFGSSVTVYRGIKYQLSAFIREVLANPDKDTLPVSFTCLGNLTADPIIAKNYGYAVLECEIPTDEVLLAPDFILPFVKDGEIANKDAELRVHGDAIQQVTTDQVLLPTTMEPLIDRLKYPKRCNEEGHLDIAAIVSYLAESGFSLSNPHAISRLWDWFDAFSDRVGVERLALLNETNEGIKTICV